jgi:NAD(P)-dependent dehydrogenase (short-subunit alcohol dehydrogenase family)
MTRITTPFGFKSTAAEVAEGIDLSGKQVIITGATSGIGLETARAVAQTGAEITLAVRNVNDGEVVAFDIAEESGNGKISVGKLDLADRESISQFVSNWKKPLHVLINNAGVMALPDLQRTKEGWEMQFAVNYLGHFALAIGLHDALASVGNARIVSVSSNAHLFSPIVFDDIHFRFRPYDPLLAYGQSKTADALFAVGATWRWGADGITANALNPGSILTGLQRHVDPQTLKKWRGGKDIDPDNLPSNFKTPEQGAATSVLLAVSPLVEGVGGRYFSDCNEAEIVAERKPDVSGVAAYALDRANAERLWEESLRMLN